MSDDEFPEECCGKCRFWSPPTESMLAANKDAEGECLRYPPTLAVTDSGVESWYPDVADFEWCGEYQPDSPQEVRRLDEPVQITAPPTTAIPQWSPSPAPVYGPGYGPKDDNSKAWPENWGK